MTQHCGFLRLKLILGLSSALVTTCANHVSAQNITIDGTLSPAQTLNGPRYTIPQSVGQTVNSNLFHSFGQFSLNQGESANFQSDGNIRNIFSRVTGGLPSNINGLISTQSPSVNLFLINPSGIIFGPNASLNIGSSTRGSFVATTADALVWSNGSQFSATNPGGTSSLLTIVGDPSGFLFNSRQPQPIQVSGGFFNVFEGQSLLLLGGDVSLDNSYLFVDFIEGGRIELGAVAEPGTAGLTSNGNILRLNFPENLARADVSLTNGSTLDVLAGNGGDIAITARNIDIMQGSGLVAGIAGGLGNINSQVGDVTLNSTGAIRTDGSSLIQNIVGTNATGNAGNIYITADSFSATDGSQVVASTVGRGNAGNIFINAKQVLFDGVNTNDLSSGAFSRVDPGAEGNGGNINITTGSLSLRNGALLNAALLGEGRNGGNVNINAKHITLNNSFIGNGVGAGGVGESGEVRIITDSLSLMNGSQIFTSTFGQGNAGNLIINASEHISLNGLSSLSSSLGEGAVDSKGGDIRITTGSLSLTNQAQIFASTFGKGDAGNVMINARDHISLNSSSGISSSVGAGRGEAEGKGGDIRITTGSLSLTNNSGIFTDTIEQGNAGNLIIYASESISLDAGAFLSSEVHRTAVGDGGDINITTGLLSLTNGATITADSRGQGNAGNVMINAQESVSLNGGESNISTALGANAVGKGGDISITTGSLFLNNNTSVLTTSFGMGDSGNVIINARERVFLDGESSNIFTALGANAVGKGGDISITTGSFSLTNNGRVSTSSFGMGDSGNVIINARERVFLDGESSNILSGLGANAVGKGGDISITTDLLLLSNEAVILASTLGRGDAGNVIINARENVILDSQSSISTSVQFTGIGNGGDINITTRSLSLDNRALLFAATLGQGNAGNIYITASEAVNISGTNSIDRLSGLTTSTLTTGKGGDINVNTNLFRLSDGAILNSQTFNDGNSGNITVNANIVELLNGSLLISNTSGRGSAGKITVNASDRVIVNGSNTTLSNVDAASGLLVRSIGSGSAGDIEVNSPFVLLDNGGRFIAESQSVNGGNITLNIGDTLLLRRGSQISTTAGTAQAGGNGGNININAGFVIAVPDENSNIKANAFSGTGGQVQINTQGIFGIEPRPNVTNFSDITASSATGINGEIIINTPNVDPSRGLTELSADTVNTSSLVDSGCSAFDNQTGSQFTVIGRGGLPPSPDENLTGDSLWSDTRLTAAKPQNSSDNRANKPVKTTDTVSIVPATNWVFNNKGEVILVSNVTQTDAYSANAHQAACPKPE